MGAPVHKAHPRFAVRAAGAELRGETPRKSGDIARVEMANSVMTQDGTASVVPPVQGSARKLIIDSGSVDAAIGSGSISSLLGDDLTGRPTMRGKPAALSRPS
jgi:hypothetical protein